MTQPKLKSIRGIPDNIYREALVHKTRRGITIGQYITEALIAMNAQMDSKKP